MKRGAQLLALLESCWTIRAAASIEELAQRALDEVFRTVLPDLCVLFASEDGALRRLALRAIESPPAASLQKLAAAMEKLALEALAGSRVYSLNLAAASGIRLERWPDAAPLSAAAIPLVGSAGVVGVIGVASSSERNLRRRHFALDCLAGDIATSLERLLRSRETSDILARLEHLESDHAATRKQLQKLKSLADILTGLARIPPVGEDAAGRADSVCRLLAENGRFRAVRLLLVDAGSGALHPVATGGETEAHFRNMELPERAATEAAAVFCNDLSQPDAPRLGCEVPTGTGCRSAAALPFFSGADVAGVLEVHSIEEGFFDEPTAARMTEVAQIVAHQVVSADMQGGAIDPWSYRTQEAIYRLIVERMPAITYVASTSRPFATTYVSPGIERSLGYSRAEWLADSDLWMRQVHPEDCSRIRAEREGLESDRNEVVSEYRIFSRAGELRWWHDHATVVRNEEGQPVLLQGTVLDITDRKREEDALRDEAARMSLALGATGDGLWDWDIRTGHVHYSPAFFEMLGYDAGDFSTHYSAWLSLVHPQDMAPALRAHIDCAEGKREGFAIEYRMKSSSGDWRWVLNRAKIVERTEDGNPARIAGTQADITVRKRTEEALAESAQRYRKLFRDSPQPAIVIERGTQAILDANAAAIAHYGYSAEEFLRMTMEDLTVAEGALTPPELLVRGTAVPSNGKPTKHRRKDGSVIDVELKAHDIELGGRPVTLLVAQDVTRRNKAEAERLRLVSLIENSSDFIGLAALDGRLLYVNDAGLRLVGEESLEEAQERYVFDYLAEERAPGETHRVFPEVLERGSWTGRERFRNLGTGAAIPLELHSFVVKDSGSGRDIALAVIARDASERKKIEAQFLQAQKMEAIGRLVSGIAHDFNNILTAIMGYSGLLKVRVADDQLASGYTESVLASAERAARLTQSLLAYSRKQLIKAQPIDLRSVVARLEPVLVRITGEDVCFRTILPDERLVVMADQNQLEQVLMNLITNARDAMPQGGTVLISASVVTLGEEYVRSHTYAEPGTYAQLSVTDSGTGMDDETRKRVFEPFFTTKEQGKGTGLGLSMVYGAIKQHGGYVDVESEPGSGTTVRLYLPLVTSDLDTEEAAEPEEPFAGKATVLVAEDDATVRVQVREALSRIGLAVVEASDGVDALEKFKANPDAIDLLLLDAIMPRKNGVEVYRAVKAIKPNVRVLFSSGYSHEIGPLKDVFREQVGYISKPFSSQQLLRKIRRALMSGNRRQN